MFGTAIKGVPR